MADEILKRDENRVSVLGAITNDSAQEVRMLRIDPATGRLIVSAVVAGTNNGQLKVSSADTTYGYLEDKLVAGSNVTLTVINVGGNEQIQIDATGTGGSSVWTDITGTPTEVAYFDESGNGTSDSLFYRLPDGTTGIGRQDGDIVYELYNGETSGILSAGFRAFDTNTGDEVFSFAGYLPEGSDVEGVVLMSGASNSSGSDTTIFSVPGVWALGVSNPNNTSIAVEFNPEKAGFSYSDLNTESKSSVNNDSDSSSIAYADTSSSISGYPVVVQNSRVEANATEATAKLWDTAKFTVKSANPSTVVQSSVTFTGTGTNDVTPSGTYTSTKDGSYEVEIVGLDAARLQYGSMNTGDFEQGDVVTGSISGATATVYAYSPNRVFVYDVVGTFQLGETLSAPGGKLSNALNNISTGDELYQYTVTGNDDDSENNAQIGFTGGSSNAIAGISAVWGSSTGHDVGDKWTWTETVVYDTVFEVDPANNYASFGSNDTPVDGIEIKGSTVTSVEITKKVSLTSSEILALNGTPKQIIDSPGAGKFIQVLSVSAKMNYGTAPYATNISMYLYDDVGGGILFRDGTAAIPGVLLPATSNTFGQLIPFSQANDPANIISDDSSVFLSTYTGNPTGGDGTLDIYITYKIITL